MPLSRRAGVISKHPGRYATRTLDCCHDLMKYSMTTPVLRCLGVALVLSLMLFALKNDVMRKFMH